MIPYHTRHRSRHASPAKGAKLAKTVKRTYSGKPGVRALRNYTSDRGDILCPSITKVSHNLSRASFLDQAASCERNVAVRE
jgi:hypothetical protein